MRLDEVINRIQPKTKIAIRIDRNVEVKMAEDFMCQYGGDENYLCDEIEPDGYIGADGCCYLTLHAYDKRLLQQDDLPFPK